MDREIETDVRLRRRFRRMLPALVAIVAVIFGVAATVNWFRPSVRRSDLELARVTRGVVESTLQASGTIVPATEQVVSSPLDSRVLRIARRAGDRVRVGDEIVVLDTSAARTDSDRLSDQVAQKESEVRELRLRVEDNLASLAAQIQQKELDAEILTFKAEQNARLHKEGLVPAQDDLVAATAAKKSTIELQQLREGLVRARETGSAQIAAANASLHALANDRAESQRQLNLAMMRADRDGVITSILSDTGAALHRGDVIARIADLSSFRVTATMSDMYAPRLAARQRVRVKVDDSTSLSGVISSVEPRMDGGVAKFNVDLDDPSHHKLRSNARVDVFVITGGLTGTLRVRRGTLAQSLAEDVFVVRGDELVATPVRWGLTDEDTAAVISGLREGDQVVVSNMSDFAGVKRLRLK